VDPQAATVILVGIPTWEKRRLRTLTAGTSTSRTIPARRSRSHGGRRRTGERLRNHRHPGRLLPPPHVRDERVTRISHAEPEPRPSKVCDARTCPFPDDHHPAGGDGVPLVLAVNMADEARARVMLPPARALEERVSGAAIPTVAVRKTGRTGCSRDGDPAPPRPRPTGPIERLSTGWRLLPPDTPVREGGPLRSCSCAATTPSRHGCRKRAGHRVRG